MAYIVSLFAKHSGSKEVVEAALVFLERVAFHGGNIPELCSLGVIATVVTAMARFQTVMSLQVGWARGTKTCVSVLSLCPHASVCGAWWATHACACVHGGDGLAFLFAWGRLDPLTLPVLLFPVLIREALLSLSPSRSGALACVHVFCVADGGHLGVHLPHHPHQ